MMMQENTPMTRDEAGADREAVEYAARFFAGTPAVGEFNALEYIAKVQLGEGLRAANESDSIELAREILLTLVDVLQGYGALAAHLRAAATVIGAMRAPAPLPPAPPPAAAPAIASSVAAPAPAPTTAPTTPLSAEGNAIAAMIDALSPADRDYVVAAGNEVREAGSTSEACAYLRDAASRAAAPAAAVLEAFAKALESSPVSAAHEECRKAVEALDEASIELWATARGEVEQAESPAEAIAYLGAVANDYDASHPALSRCLRLYSQIVEAAASAGAAAPRAA